MAKLILPTIILLLISAFGIYSILALTELNGWGDSIRASIDSGSLPSGEPLRKSYTGVGGLDAFLTPLVIFFYSCTTGERRGLSVFTVYFAGQIVPAHTVLVLEGLRKGNRGTALYFPVVWGLVYQCIPFGVTLPIYCVVHLWHFQAASERSERNLLIIDPAKLSTVPAAMLLGFALPTALPTLPGALISAHTRQGFLALWQIFPLIISIAHRVLAFVSRPTGTSSRLRPRNAAARIDPARKVYKQLLSLAGSLHLAVITFVTLPELRHALLGSSATSLDVEAVFRPMSAFSPHQIEDLAEGSQTLLQYDMYCGCAAAFVWAVALSYMATGSRISAAAWTSGKLVLRSFLVGPGGAVLWSFWDRDEENSARTGLVEKKE